METIFLVITEFHEIFRNKISTDSNGTYFESAELYLLSFKIKIRYSLTRTKICYKTVLGFLSWKIEPWLYFREIISRKDQNIDQILITLFILSA